MQDSTNINDFIDSLKKDRLINAGITAHKYIPQKDANFADLEMKDEIKNALKSRGIEKFYTHQVEGINLIRQGQNVVVMTPTASGKSLIYNIPVIESILENPETKALYIFPLKGLEQDQVKNFNELMSEVWSLELGVRSFCAVYDGDTTPYRRKKIREHIPNVIFTNPDMIHLALNPFHKKWEEFFKNLKYIAITIMNSTRAANRLLLPIIQKYFGSKTKIENDVHTAVKNAIKNSTKNDLILVCGSLYLLSAFLSKEQLITQ